MFKGRLRTLRSCWVYLACGSPLSFLGRLGQWQTTSSQRRAIVLGLDSGDSPQPSEDAEATGDADEADHAEDSEDPGPPPTGIPGFWRTVLTSSRFLSKYIGPHDPAIFDHVTDMSIATDPDTFVSLLFCL